MAKSQCGKRNEGPRRCPIDAAALERMAGLARGFPGKTVSLVRTAPTGRGRDDCIVLRIDNASAAEHRQGAALEPLDAA